MKIVGLVWVLAGAAWGQGTGAPRQAVEARQTTEAMARTVIAAWPDGSVPTTKSPGKWGYEEGVLLDGLAAEWEVTRDPAELAYIRRAVDKYIRADGTIQMDSSGRAFATDEHQLDNIELGRAILFLYRQTHEERYATAAKFLHEQLRTQPRGASGGYWHKQIYPNQMWLDGAYMAEPFRAEYAAVFHEDGDWGDIAQQFFLMDAHMRDARTGLLKHGWDESKAIAWADKRTGLSPEVWARAMGWYAMALVDVLDWFPKERKERAELIEVLNRTLEAVWNTQDQSDRLWWQVMDHHPVKYGMVDNDPRRNDAQAWAHLHQAEQEFSKGNFAEASASAMFVYALRKSVRMRYPTSDSAPTWERAADWGWNAIQHKFLKENADGTVTLTGTVKAAGLGGTPYRSGTYEYYIGEKTGDQDAKGVGAYLLAGSEMGRRK